jgi:hypothetical protein
MRVRGQGWEEGKNKQMCHDVSSCPVEARYITSTGLPPSFLSISAVKRAAEPEERTEGRGK